MSPRTSRRIVEKKQLSVGRVIEGSQSAEDSSQLDDECETTDN